MSALPALCYSCSRLSGEGDLDDLLLYPNASQYIGHPTRASESHSSYSYTATQQAQLQGLQTPDSRSRPALCQVYNNGEIFVLRSHRAAELNGWFGGTAWQRHRIQVAHSSVLRVGPPTPAGVFCVGCLELESITLNFLSLTLTSGRMNHDPTH